MLRFSRSSGQTIGEEKDLVPTAGDPGPGTVTLRTGPKRKAESRACRHQLGASQLLSLCWEGSSWEGAPLQTQLRGWDF